MQAPRERATGIIKKVFFKKSEPFGFLKLLMPLELRGEEAVFYLKDMLLQPFEKKVLHHGMMMEFYLREKTEDFMQSPVPFRAEELRPLDPAEYSASVIRGADPRRGREGLLVCLDVSLARACISAESYEALQLKTPLLPGDTCRVRISWKEMLDASLQGKTPTGEIVEVTSKNSNLVIKRTVSHEVLPAEANRNSSPEKTSDTPEGSSETTNENASDEETGCDTDSEIRLRRSRNAEFVPMRRRCRSVGDCPRLDMPPFPPEMCGSFQNYGHMYPHMPFPPFVHPEELQFGQAAMQAPQFHSRNDQAQCFSAMNQCYPPMMASPYQHSAMNSAQWVPQSCQNPRQMKMSLREFLERGGKIF